MRTKQRGGAAGARAPARKEREKPKTAEELDKELSRDMHSRLDFASFIIPTNRSFRIRQLFAAVVRRGAQVTLKVGLVLETLRIQRRSRPRPALPDTAQSSGPEWAYGSRPQVVRMASVLRCSSERGSTAYA